MTYDLFSLIEQDDTQGIKRAIEKGINVNSLNEEGETPLIAAILNLDSLTTEEQKKKRENTIIEFLEYAHINAPADDLEYAHVNTRATDGETPLSAAILRRNIKIIHSLVEKGANINYQDEDGLLFHILRNYSSWKKDDALSIIKFLLENGADINARNHDAENNTALLFALSNYRLCNNIRLITFLLDNGADINTQTKYGDTPLFKAMTYTDIKKEAMVKCLLKYEPKVNCTVLQFMNGLSDSLKGQLLFLSAPDLYKPLFDITVGKLSSDDIILLRERVYQVDSRMSLETQLSCLHAYKQGLKEETIPTRLPFNRSCSIM